jgi:adenine-specific DNA-methyltransferase
MEKVTQGHSMTQSPDFVKENIELLKSLFPTIVKEGKIDLEELQALLGDEVETDEEYYRLTWAGKSMARREANKPSTGTLRPKITESKDWAITKNIFVEGDNLEALKLLQKSYANKIKLIYIDPPYNTGKDFVYKDNYSDNLTNYLAITGQLDEIGKRTSTNTESDGRYHSNWLNMMYPRLKIARNLLTDNGIIMISIDEKEVHNLKKLSDEIFGEQNFAGEIIWKNSSKNDQDYISIQHEYFICYVKDKNINKGNWVEKKEGLDEIYKAFDQFRLKHGNDWEAIHKEANEWYKQFPESNSIYASKHYSWMDVIGVYFPDNISGPNFGQYRYDVIHPVTGMVCKEPASGWRYPEDTMRQRIADNLVHFGKDHTTVPNNKTYLKNTEFQSLTSIRYKDGRVASKGLAKLMGENIFTNPKDADLLMDIFKTLEVNSNDIILDFFAGSGTTAESVLKLNEVLNCNCSFILVQIQENLYETLKTATGSSKATLNRAIEYLESRGLPANLCELAKERIRKAGEKIKSERILDLFSEDTKPIDIGFKVFKLDTSNINAWDGNPENLQANLFNAGSNIKVNRTEEDVLFEILLKNGLDLAQPIE